MTKTRQDKSAKPAAVELRADALDQAAGGGDPITFTATVRPAAQIAQGDGNPDKPLILGRIP